MTEIDITLRQEKRTEEVGHKIQPVRMPVWVAETDPCPTVTGQTPEDCLDALATMLEQGVSGESAYDREDDDE